MTRGGKREGAGRPAGSGETVPRAVRMRAEDIALWDALVERHGCTQAEVVRMGLKAVEDADRRRAKRRK